MAVQDWSLPTVATLVEDVITMIKERTAHVAMLDYGSDTNIPANFKRYNSTNNKFENYNGTTWATLGFHTAIDNHIADTSIHASLPPGIVVPYGGTASPVPPSGWLLCDGSAVSRTTYSALFTIIGTTFGSGDGSTTFNLPDLRGRFPLGKSTGGTGSTLGGTGGQLDHFHTGPSHSHTMNAHTHDMGNHTHTGGAHTHTVPDHTHAVPGHFHSTTATGATIAIATSSGAHNVDIPRRSFPSGGSAVGGTDSRVPLTDNAGINNGTLSIGANNHTHDHSTFSGTVGLTSGGANGDAPFNTGTINGGAGSTGSAGAVATGAPSTNTTGSTTSTMQAAGTGNTGAANPPFQVFNYLIKT